MTLKPQRMLPMSLDLREWAVGVGLDSGSQPAMYGRLSTRQGCSPIYASAPPCRGLSTKRVKRQPGLSTGCARERVAGARHC